MILVSKKFSGNLWCSSLLVLLLAASTISEADSNGWPNDASIQDDDCFDYIIIGTGVGAVVANRLSEDSRLSILLIEAGTIPSNESRYAGNFGKLPNTYMDWQFKSEPELATQSQSDDVFKLAAGRTLGGTSQINHIIWLRGDPHDFNSWSEIVNDPSWSFDSVLPYFLKSESIKDTEILSSSSADHNTNGPIEITRETSEKNDDYLRSFEEIGHEVKIELNTRNTIGCTQPTVMNNYLRQSTSEKYIKPIANRKNLHITYKSVATKINIVNNVAVSVNVLINGKEITVKACKEIILSAGVYNSPKLLMLSGVGPKEHLIGLNIPVLKDLPVGKNLQDHVAVLIVTKMKESNETVEEEPVTRIGFPVIIDAVKLNDSLDYPQGQTTNLQFAHDTFGPASVCDVVFGYKKSICDQLVKSSAGRDVLLTFASIVDPSSAGEVTLSSTDPLAPPVVRFGFYSDQSDLNQMVALIENFKEILNTTFFTSVNAEFVNLTFDDCKGDFSMKEYIRCYSEHMSTTLYHQVGTCAMGTVVDSKLKVIGVENLRVVDASVMPHIPTANPMAAAVMIAEKASDMIKSAQSDVKCKCKGNKRHEPAHTAASAIRDGLSFFKDAARTVPKPFNP